MLTDIEIAQQTKLRPIAEIAEELHICPEELEPYGRFKAKLNDDRGCKTSVGVWFSAA